MGVPILKALAPLPRIVKHKNAVFVGPHPDDIEIGAGGTAATLVRLGARVTFVVCTDGGGGAFDDAVDPATLVTRRREEALRGASVLGVDDVRYSASRTAGNTIRGNSRRNSRRCSRTCRPTSSSLPIPGSRRRFTPTI